MAENQFDRLLAQRLLDSQNGEKSAVLITSDVNIRYFTDFLSADSALLIMKDRSLFLTDSRYITAAEHLIKNAEVLLTSDMCKSVNEIALANGINKLYFEAECITVAMSAYYKKSFPGMVLDFSGAADCAIKKLRLIKNENQLEKIKRAQAITEAAFENVLGFIKEGVTEREIALKLEFFMRASGAERVAFDLIVAAGKNGACPHAVPGDYSVKSGDMITMDIGAVYLGWHSDMTRTVALGGVNEEQRRIYNIVLQAQLAAIDKIKAGAICSEIDLTARTIINDAGYGEYFGHGLGHGVGMEIHEAPRLSPRCNTLLEEGMVVTVEPGIYIPERYGVRTEDMVFVTQNGCENLTKTSKELIIL